MSEEQRLTATGALSEEGHAMLRLQRLHVQFLEELQEQTRILKDIWLGVAWIVDQGRMDAQVRRVEKMYEEPIKVNEAKVDIEALREAIEQKGKFMRGGRYA